MPTLATYECSECGESFKAVDGARAAENGYCSPACETAAKGLS
jgi:predicted nucleic acid-binding Zn ribbon protein